MTNILIKTWTFVKYPIKNAPLEFDSIEPTKYKLTVNQKSFVNGIGHRWCEMHIMNQLLESKIIVHVYIIYKGLNKLPIKHGFTVAALFNSIITWCIYTCKCNCSIAGLCDTDLNKSHNTNISSFHETKVLAGLIIIVT